MKKHFFPIIESLGFGLKTVFNHPFFFAQVAAVSILVMLVDKLVRMFEYDRGNLLLNIFFLFYLLLVFLFQQLLVLGLIKISLKYVETGSLIFTDLFNALAKLPRYIILLIICLLILWLPSLLWLFLIGLVSDPVWLTICGTIFMLLYIFIIVRLFFSPFVLVDQESGAIDALLTSVQLSRDVEGGVFLLILLLLAANLAGLILFGIGLIVTVPATTIAAAYMYKKLKVKS